MATKAATTKQEPAAKAKAPAGKAAKTMEAMPATPKRAARGTGSGAAKGAAARSGTKGKATR